MYGGGAVAWRPPDRRKVRVSCGEGRVLGVPDAPRRTHALERVVGFVWLSRADTCLFTRPRDAKARLCVPSINRSEFRGAICRGRERT